MSKSKGKKQKNILLKILVGVVGLAVIAMVGVVAVNNFGTTPKIFELGTGRNSAVLKEWTFDNKSDFSANNWRLSGYADLKLMPPYLSQGSLIIPSTVADKTYLWNKNFVYNVGSVWGLVVEVDMKAGYGGSGIMTTQNLNPSSPKPKPSPEGPHNYQMKLQLLAKANSAGPVIAEKEVTATANVDRQTYAFLFKASELKSQVLGLKLYLASANGPIHSVAIDAIRVMLIQPVGVSPAPKASPFKQSTSVTLKGTVAKNNLEGTSGYVLKADDKKDYYLVFSNNDQSDKVDGGGKGSGQMNQGVIPPSRKGESQRRPGQPLSSPQPKPLEKFVGKRVEIKGRLVELAKGYIGVPMPQARLYIDEIREI